MFPIVAAFGPFHLYSYGLTIAIGVALAFYLMRKAALSDGFPTAEQAYDFIFISVVTGFIGARVYYVIQHHGEFHQNPLEVFAIWQGGLIFYGGLAAGFFSLWIYSRRQKLSFAKMMDFILPYGALVHAFGRVGCFLNGCCYGSAAQVPWAVIFPGLDHSVHPAQLYEAAYNLGVFFILKAFYQSRPSRGKVTAAYLMLYGFGRFVIEIFRPENPGWGMTWNQWISLGLVIAGLLTLWWASNQQRVWQSSKGRSAL